MKRSCRGRGSFDEPHPRDIDYNKVDGDDYGIYRSGLYPFNHVFETESGHLTELDDTQAMKEL